MKRPMGGYGGRAVLAAGILGVLGFSLLLGRYPRPGFMPWGSLEGDPVACLLLLHVRLPRVLAAFLVGAVLAGAGNVFQMIFANPLVEPGFLGVSQGAAFGAALAIVLTGGNPPAVQGLAVFFALTGLALSYLLARRLRFGGWTLRLVLSGIAVSALFTSGVGIIKYGADPISELPEIAYWMLGGLWGLSWISLLRILPVTLLSLTVLYLLRWRLNLLSLEDAVGFSLGGEPGRERVLLLSAAGAAVAAVVSVSGIVGWAGLIIPHLARRWTGADARRSFPASLGMGGIFVLLCDDLARTATAGEIPLGILTALFGAALFLGLFSRRQVRGRKAGMPGTGGRK